MSVVMITGCSTGIGKMTALEFARRGDTVYATMRDLTKSEELKNEAEKEGLELNIIQLDVTDQKSIDAAVSSVLEEKSRIDVLVNNAGLSSYGPIEYFSIEEIESVFDTNLLGVVRVTQAVLPSMRNSRSGIIINISSISGVKVFSMTGVYAASKHALEALSEALRYELHPFNIRVSLIEPGNFETPLMEKVIAETQDRVSRVTRVAEYDKMMGYLENEEFLMQPAQPAQIVADAIVDVVYNNDNRLRYLVGEDAKKWASKTDVEHEEFVMQGLNEILN